MKKSQLLAKESKRVLSEGDKVRARIIAISLGEGSRRGKIGLTMRQPFLGRLDWFHQEEKEAEGKESKEQKEQKEPQEKKGEKRKRGKEPAKETTEVATEEAK
jgi:DNA-directed RNA polymerase subunit E'